MEINCLKNNELITGISILAVLQHVESLDVAKCMLIEPLLSYTKVLQILRRANSSVKSMEDLIIKESISFANFNERYKERLMLSINAILLFGKLGLIDVDDNRVIFAGKGFDFREPTLGEKAKSRIVASRNLAMILMKGETSDLYLSLRIEI